MTVTTFRTPQGREIAYVFSQGEKMDLPCVMFMGGFRSDMTGTKAMFLEAQCRTRGQSFVRFDYSGHGQSSGAFEDGTIGAWKEDAQAVLEIVLKDCPRIVAVGSSMGGWIGLLLAREFPQRMAGLVGIAAAPDFTSEIEARMSAAQRHEMVERGRVAVPSDYDAPYVFTRDLIEDGRRHLLLNARHDLGVAMILVQGKRDADVPWEKALRIKECCGGKDTEVILIDEGDHRLSTPQDLDIIDGAVRKLSGL